MSHVRARALHVAGDARDEHGGGADSVAGGGAARYSDVPSREHRRKLSHLRKVSCCVVREPSALALLSRNLNLNCVRSTPANFITAVVEMFRAELLVANEYVFTADEPGKHLYIIHIGRVEVRLHRGISPMVASIQHTHNP